MHGHRVTATPASLLFLLGLLRGQDLLTVAGRTLDLILKVVADLGQLRFLFCGQLLGGGAKEQALELRDEGLLLVDRLVLAGDRLGLLRQRLELCGNLMVKLVLQLDSFLDEGRRILAGFAQKFFPSVHTASFSRKRRPNG